jgi:hypothetical protein
MKPPADAAPAEPRTAPSQPRSTPPPPSPRPRARPGEPWKRPSVCTRRKGTCGPHGGSPELTRPGHRSVRAPTAATWISEQLSGRRLGAPPKDESEHFMRCPACGGWSTAVILLRSSTTKAHCHIRHGISRNAGRYQEKFEACRLVWCIHQP